MRLVVASEKASADPIFDLVHHSIYHCSYCVAESGKKIPRPCCEATVSPVSVYSVGDGVFLVLVLTAVASVVVTLCVVLRCVVLRCVVLVVAKGVVQADGMGPLLLLVVRGCGGEFSELTANVKMLGGSRSFGTFDGKVGGSVLPVVGSLAALSCPSKPCVVGAAPDLTTVM